MGIFRFYLASIVALTHLAIEIGVYKNQFIGLNLDAEDAVNIFFFISGFIIPLSYSKKYNQNNFLVSYNYFFLARIIRIFPIYFLSILLIYFDYKFLNIIKLSQHSPFGYDNINNIIQELFLFKEYYSLNAPAWSLNVEFRWYLIIPIYIFLSNFFKEKNNKKIIFYLNTIIIFSLLFYFFKNLFLLKSLWYFFGGLITFKIFSIIKINKFNLRTNILILLPLILISFFLSKQFSLFIHLIVTFVLCLSINYKNKFDSILGDLSYPIYILHMPIMIIIYLQVNKYLQIFLSSNNIFYNFTSFFISYLILVLICLIVNLVYQNPIDKLKKKYLN
jgi:peptidoglycan/LPS O-acetylase OafA/YrhL